MPEQEIRKFSSQTIQRYVEEAVARDLPSGRQLAAVAHVTLEGDVVLSLVAKLGDQISVAAEGYKPYKGKLEGRAAVVWSPF